LYDTNFLTSIARLVNLLETSAVQTSLFLTHPSQVAVSMSANGDGVNAAVSLGEIFLGEEALGTC